MRKLAYRGVLMALAAGALAGCAPESAQQSAAGAARSTFNRGNGGEPDTLDPHRNEETSGAAILRDLYEGLVTEDVDLNIVPGVAHSWQISEDGRRYTFELREDALWSNGDRLTAMDFVAGIRRTVDPSTASTYAQILLPIRNARQVIAGELPPDALGVRATSDREIQIELENPTPYFLQVLARAQAYPIHRPSLEAHGDRFARPGNLISNGAYRLTQWVVNSHIRLEKNEHYHGSDDVQIEVVNYFSTENRDAELRRYRAGELDYTYEIPTSQYQWISENLPGELRVQPYLTVYFYGFDTTEPPFDDVRLRQALTMTVDRKIITEQVTGVGELPAYGLVPPGIAEYDEQSYEWAGLDAEQRIAEARKLYAAAGYSQARPLRAQLRFNTSENHRRIAVAVASMWQQSLGAEIEIINQEWKVMLQDRRNPALWDIMRYGWNADYADAYTFLEIFQSDHGQNFTGLSNPRFDALVAAASEENDEHTRLDLMAQAERELLQSYAVVPLYFYVTRHIVKPYVEGYRPNALDHNRSQHYSIVPH